jgi:hypothetical protein
LNWHLFLTKDEELVKKLLPVAEKLLLANRSRDLDGNSIADVDIGTTYDVSDALHVAPNNVYLGVKEMAAYLVGAELCDRFGCKSDSASIFRKEAKKILATLKKAEKEFGYLPTALDQNYNGWNQASVVLGDGLLYLALTGFSSPELQELSPILKKSFLSALEKSRRDWGVVMTESEGIIFYSKVMVLEPVSKYIYKEPTELWQAVYEWNRDNPQAYNDGAYSSTKPWPGYNYSRGVIIFWELLPPPGM